MRQKPSIVTDIYRSSANINGKREADGMRIRTQQKKNLEAQGPLALPRRARVWREHVIRMHILNGILMHILDVLVRMHI